MAEANATGSDPIIAFLNKSQPNLQNAFDPLVLAIHSEILAVGCQLRAIDEDASEQELANLPGRWNASEGIYTFIYRKDNKKITFKCLVIDDMLSANVSVEGSDNVFSIDLSTAEYINSDNLNDYTQVFKSLPALRKSIQENIINAASLKPQAEPPRQQQQNADRPRNPLRVDPVGHDPLRVGPPRRPVGGDFDADVSPFGPGPGLMGPGIGNPGNLMGPGHGAFGPRGIRPQRGPGGIRNPPGSRFDPTGPFGGPGIGDPDPDHFQMPGRGGRGGRGGFGGGFGGPMI